MPEPEENAAPSDAAGTDTGARDGASGTDAGTTLGAGASTARTAPVAPLFGLPVPQRLLGPGGLAAALVAAGAVLIFALMSPWGYAPLLAGVALGFAASRPLGRDLGLIVLGLGIISTISVEADIAWPRYFLMGGVLTAAVVAPWLVHRFVLRDDAIRFPRRRGRRWSRLEWGWLAFVLLTAYFVLPFYFLRSGAYENWPAVTTPSEIGRLFVGVNAVGIWDELFFICTVFTLLARHFPFWTANVLTSVIFVSFLWELGYRSWGPLLTIPFALVQAVVFTRTKSLPYTITVHLLFDLVVFLSIAHAHHPDRLPIFVY
ncbi:type II CAAX endopeptidase family protein [Brevibacterium sp.]|uniref:type II CAAX endopeptidase family protein n=1 Tax=Brevibacterium sp. TaxID=1701 RepID=UPI0025BBE043|nr:type II CAAX endopeptidase family protein [Brevibacterium sp.]